MKFQAVLDTGVRIEPMINEGSHNPKFPCRLEGHSEQTFVISMEHIGSDLTRVDSFTAGDRIIHMEVTLGSGKVRKTTETFNVAL
jgi:hypothetical protein